MIKKYGYMVKGPHVLFFLCSCALNTGGTLEYVPGDHAADPDVAEPSEPDVDVAEDLDAPGEEDGTIADIDEVEYPEGWLHEYASRIKLTVRASGIDEDLFGFPLLVRLDGSVPPADAVFLELVERGDRGKIAVTGGDGTSKYLVEIEKWDDAGLRAWLWVRIPELPGYEDTILYLYFDARAPGNEDMVGDTGTVPAMLVWEERDFAGVWHLSRLDTVKDSTAGRNDGATSGSMNASEDLVEGMIGDGVDFDGEDDHVELGDMETNSWGAVTAEAWFKARTIGDERLLCKADGETTSMHVFSLGIVKAGSVDYKGRARVGTEDGGGADGYDTDVFISTGTWHHLAFTWSMFEGKVRVYGDGEVMVEEDHRGSSLADSGVSVCIGNINPSIDRHFDGVMDEVRLSKEARSVAYIRTSYLAARGELVELGLLETLD